PPTHRSPSPLLSSLPPLSIFLPFPLSLSRSLQQGSIVIHTDTCTCTHTHTHTHTRTHTLLVGGLSSGSGVVFHMFPTGVCVCVQNCVSCVVMSTAQEVLSASLYMH